MSENPLKIFKNQFIKNVFILSSGTASAQAFYLLMSPVLTRLYTPSDFGIFALFTSITSIISVVSCGRYELAILIPKDDKEAVNLGALSMLINIFISLIILSIIMFSYDFIRKLSDYDLSYWIYFIPLAVFLMGLFQTLNYTNNRFKKYKDISKANFYRAISANMIQLFLGFLKLGGIGLIFGQTASFFFSNFKLFKNIYSTGLLSEIKIRKIFTLAKDYKNRVIYGIPGAFADNISSNLQMFILPIVFGYSIAGQFMLAMRITYSPMSLIGSAISQVFFREIIEYIHEQRICLPLFLLIAKRLLAFSGMAMILFVILGLFFFEFIFGVQWKTAGIITAFLAISLIFRMVASPLSIILTLEKYTRKLFVWQVSYLLTSSTVLFLAYILKLSLLTFLVIYTLEECALYIFYYHLIYNTIKDIDRNIVKCAV